MKNRLRELRIARNLFQKDVSYVIGVTQSTLSNWECSKHVISSEHLVKLAEYYGVPIDYILGVDPMPIEMPIESGEQTKINAHDEVVNADIEEASDILRVLTDKYRRQGIDYLYFLKKASANKE